MLLKKLLLSLKASALYDYYVDEDAFVVVPLTFKELKDLQDLAYSFMYAIITELSNLYHLDEDDLIDFCHNNINESESSFIRKFQSTFNVEG